MSPPHVLALSPGLLSTCLLHRHFGQWLVYPSPLTNAPQRSQAKSSTRFWKLIHMFYQGPTLVENYIRTTARLPENSRIPFSVSNFLVSPSGRRTVITPLFRVVTNGSWCAKTVSSPSEPGNVAETALPSKK